MAATTCWSFFLLILLTLYPPFLRAENIALGKATFQHGTFGMHRSGLAVDGNRNQDGSTGDCAVSDSYDQGLGQGAFTPAWWVVDLGTSDVSELFYIQRVTIFNRRDSSQDNIRDSLIKIGNFRDTSIQVKCASIDTAKDLVQRFCNLNMPVRYLSIVSNHASSLHLCEVEVEGYSNKVFQNRFAAPVITEVRYSGVALLQINPPQQPVDLYQVLYTALSGDTNERYGNKTTQAEGYLIEQPYLFPGTQYSIRVLGIIKEGQQEKAKMISNEVIIRTPLDSEILRIDFPPQQISVDSTSIQIKFKATVGTWYYKVEVMSGTAPMETRQVTSDPSKTVYTEVIDGLQPSTSYTMYIIPYSQLDRVPVRGIQSPDLVFQTLNAGVSDVPRTTQYMTQGPFRSSVWVPLPTGTMGPRASTGGPFIQRTTHIPSNTVYTPKTTTTLGVLMNCTSGTGGPYCAEAVQSDWVVPAAAGGAAGVVVLVTIALIIAVCIRRRRKKADDGGDTALNRQSNTYNDQFHDEAIHPQYYSSTLPTNSEANTISELGSKRNSAATVTGSQTSKASKSSRQEPEPEPTDEENKLHEDIDTLYAQINKSPSTYNSQHGIGQ